MNTSEHIGSIATNRTVFGSTFSRTFGKVKRFKVTARVFDKRGRLLAKADNDYNKTHPEQARVAKMMGRPRKVFLHAEVKAIMKSVRKGTPYKISVERFDSCGNPKTAFPCMICMEFIKRAGIKKIEATVG